MGDQEAEAARQNSIKLKKKIQDRTGMNYFCKFPALDEDYAECARGKWSIGHILLDYGLCVLLQLTANASLTSQQFFNF